MKLPALVEVLQDHYCHLCKDTCPTSPPRKPGRLATASRTRRSCSRAMSAANGEKLARLWMGDRSNYASDSEAGLAERSTEVTG